jgi:protein-tyrosine phosphatase
VVVHCSAGCGRTGTFCTVDSVIDMLKRQRLKTSVPPSSEGDWVHNDNDDIDLIANTVEDFRSQRLSMVQTLRQFVLCYESVLEWITSQALEKGHNSDDSTRSITNSATSSIRPGGRSEGRRSYHG